MKDNLPAMFVLKDLLDVSPDGRTQYLTEVRSCKGPTIAMDRTFDYLPEALFFASEHTADDFRLRLKDAEVWAVQKVYYDGSTWKEKPSSEGKTSYRTIQNNVLQIVRRK